MSKNGLHLIAPTSIASSGTSATINTNGSVSFTTCDSVSLNGVFSADYDNYKVVLRGTSTTGGYVRFRMRLSGTDNSTTSSYVHQNIYASGTTVNGARSTTTHAILNGFGTDVFGTVANIYGPYIAQPTAARSITIGLDSSVSTPIVYDHAFTHNQSVAYDGFTIYTGSGASTFTGLIAVYGLRK